ncbi:MAG: hypothetical protein [Bacteriophage sp.]|nr:MAG: hypothetical protein [Bacteriophage sp.]
MNKTEIIAKIEDALEVNNEFILQTKNFFLYVDRELFVECNDDAVVAKLKENGEITDKLEIVPYCDILEVLSDEEYQLKMFEMMLGMGILD